MPWCPKCKSEYVDGITECSECKVALVDQLPEEREPFMKGQEPLLEELKDFLECNGFGEISMTYDMDKAEASLYMDKALKSDEALERACAVFMSEKRKKAGKDAELDNKMSEDIKDESQLVDEITATSDEEDSVQEDHREQGSTYAGTYQNKRDKAADFMSSAYTLVIVGVLGIIALVLLEMGVLPIRLAGPGRYMTYILMGALFVIFIITGIFSFKSAKKYESQSADEDQQTEDIKQWVKSHLDAAQIKESMAAKVADLPEEMQYFQYFEQVKKEIKQQFEVTDEAYLDALVEELYPVLFENKNSEL